MTLIGVSMALYCCSRGDDGADGAELVGVFEAASGSHVAKGTRRE